MVARKKLDQSLNKKRLKRKQNPPLHIILCEGESEVGYLSQVLDSRKCKVTKADSSLAENIVNQANQMNLVEEQKIYCIFDYDCPEHNTKEQLNKVASIFSKNQQLIRVLSVRCFEIIFLLANGATGDKYHTKCDDLVKDINKFFKIKYTKNMSGIKKFCQKLNLLKINFTQICDKNKQVYDKLKIDNDNWLGIAQKQSFSEIFKLKDFILNVKP